jgi:crossover junction endodeoxyribonuclease RuvC
MPIMLALDLGTTTGWAVSTDGHITSGTECFNHDRYSGGGMRFLRFRKWLDEMKALNNTLDEVYFEEVRRHRGTDAAHVYGGFMGHLTAWCEQHEIPYRGIPVGTIKRFMTGNGSSNKDAMIEAVKAKGHQPKDDNEADALALLYWRLDNN